MSKTIIITGSTDGIGKLVALQLACDGHEIFIHGRNQQKLHRTIEEIVAQSENTNIHGLNYDFSDLDSVKTMASEIHRNVEKIDVLINNAGVFKSKSRMTATGIDMRFAVNYFAPFILTEQLIPLLNRSKSPRVINLSSAAQSPLSIAALQGEKTLTEQESYAQSKLALTMWSAFLAEHNPSIDVVAVNPGSLLNTKMVQEAYGHYWSSSTKGADILYELVVAAKYKNLASLYFDNDHGDFSDAHPDVYDEACINELIKATRTIIK